MLIALIGCGMACGLLAGSAGGLAGLSAATVLTLYATVGTAAALALAGRWARRPAPVVTLPLRP